MDVRVRPWKSWMPKNSCFWAVVLETTFESPLDCKKTTPVHPKGNQSSIFIGRTWWSWSSDTLATWCKELMHWERPLCWERLKMRGEGDDTGWDGCMASLTQWTWVWAGSGSWWWTGKPGFCRPWIADSDHGTESVNCRPSGRIWNFTAKCALFV